MKFLIFSHVVHVQKDGAYYGYGPYIKEMNLWSNYVDELWVIAPLVTDTNPDPIDLAYVHPRIKFIAVPSFQITSLSHLPAALWASFIVLVKGVFYSAKADHLHLRCPGNMGLLACMIQIFFPWKPKTAKYAGNWDPKAKQPFTYKLQRWILSNIFLTKNMQVLVYGDWENQSKNIKPFFTATYSEFEKKDVCPRKLDGLINFLFVGTLSIGKQPLFAVQLVEKLYQSGKKVRLNLYGEGVLKTTLEEYIKVNELQDIIFLHGNQSKETILIAYQLSHFLILPSKSEGWPKVIAEGMFWGCVPIVSKVSCVPYMLGNGTRGILLNEELEIDVQKINHLLLDELNYQEMVLEGQKWSRQFTTNFFEKEIKKILFS